MSDIDDLQITYRGQLYRRIGRKLHNGATTKLAVWHSTRPTCGEPFTFETTRLRKLARASTGAASAPSETSGSPPHR
jgi:hypothetical protein